MKDFKKLPKMKCGGNVVKKYNTGGNVEKGYSYDKEAFSNLGAKTPIGAHVARSVQGGTLLNHEPLQKNVDRIIQYRDEADDEVQRESTRGIKPENRKKRGGSVKRKK